MPIPLRPPIKYHGGKYYLCRWIISHFPDHQTYVEPFGGAASVLLNKTKAHKEIYNDLELSIYNLILCLKDQCPALVDILKNTEYSENVYYHYKKIYFSEEFQHLSSLDKAATTYIARRMSRGGVVRNFSWSVRLAKDGTPQEVNAWNTMLNLLPVISERLQNVDVLNENALDVIKKYDSKNTLFYLDPPYLKSSRKKSENIYLKELKDDDHVQLGELLQSVVGKVVLSGYPSEMYQRFFGDWKVIEKQVSSHASHTKKKESQTECLWLKL